MLVSCPELRLLSSIVFLGKKSQEENVSLFSGSLMGIQVISNHEGPLFSSLYHYTHSIVLSVQLFGENIGRDFRMTLGLSSMQSKETSWLDVLFSSVYSVSKHCRQCLFSRMQTAISYASLSTLTYDFRSVLTKDMLADFLLLQQPISWRILF